MAYDRKNRLLRIIDIQEIYKKHSKNHQGGCTDKHIFENMIYPVYRISRTTFYEYLSTPAKKQLKECTDTKPGQLTLFN